VTDEHPHQRPPAAYEARLMVNGVRYTATLPTREDAEDWLTVIRAGRSPAGCPGGSR
jgi:hypothetical protein